jgi:osmotically-inducible protein OsmY
MPESHAPPMIEAVPRSKEQVMSNEQLQHWVTEELAWDPKIDCKAIAVAADHGAITLRGTVGSFGEKRDAAKAAERVYGVKSVTNDLKVRLLTEHGREDADLRGAVLRALELDSLVPGTIEARVDDGWVTLTGSAEWQFQRQEAAYVAGNVLGVIGVDDQIDLMNPQPSARDVKESIQRALARDAKVEADDLVVDTHEGTVAVIGRVRSWAEHDSAIAAAWAAPGVSEVADHIVVDYP